MKKIYLFYTCDSNKTFDSMRVQCVTTSVHRLKKSLIDNINGCLIPGLTKSDKDIHIRKVNEIFSRTNPFMVGSEINRYFSGYIYIQTLND